MRAGLSCRLLLLSGRDNPGSNHYNALTSGIIGLPLASSSCRTHREIEMLNGQTYRPLPQDEDDVGEVLDIPMIAPPPLHQNGHENGHARSASGKPPRWSRNQLGRHVRASLVRLFGLARPLIYHKIAQILLALSLLTFLLGLAFRDTKAPALPPVAEPPVVEPPVAEDSIFKVGFSCFNSRTIPMPRFCRTC